MRSYIVEESNSIDTEPVLHSTMMATPSTSRGRVVMNSAMDSSQMSSSHSHLSSTQPQLSPSHSQLSSSQMSHYGREMQPSADSSLGGDAVTNGEF